MQKGQAERLIPMLEQILAGAGIRWPDLDALAVGTGPGNFTGVRIAVAAARGLALGLDIPALGVTRLEALAHGLQRPVTVIEDARRGAAYVQSFDTTLVFGDGKSQLEVDTGDRKLRERFQSTFAEQRAAGRKFLLQRETPVLPLSTLAVAFPISVSSPEPVVAFSMSNSVSWPIWVPLTGSAAPAARLTMTPAVTES